MWQERGDRNIKDSITLDAQVSGELEEASWLAIYRDKLSIFQSLGVVGGLEAV